MSTPLASPDDLQLYLGAATIDTSRAALILSLAQGLCETVVTPLSDGAKGVVLAVAARAYENVTSRAQESVGGISGTYSATGLGGVGGLFLSRADKATLRRSAGRLTSYSVDTISRGANAVQSVILSGAPTGGTFTLAFGGVPTSPIPFNADAATVAAALVAVPGIGSNNVAVTGTPGSWQVTFTGSLGTAPMPLLVAASSLTGGTSPSVQVATVTAGRLAAGQGLSPWNYDYYGRSGINETPGGFL